MFTSNKAIRPYLYRLLIRGSFAAFEASNLFTLLFLLFGEPFAWSHYMDTESENPECRTIIVVLPIDFSDGGDNGPNEST